MSYEVVYTACSINNKAAAFHWGKNNLICFGSSHLVCIYDPLYGSGGKVVCTLLAHQAFINSTRWIGEKDHETELISASTDGKVILWSKKEEEFSSYTIVDCKENVIIADGCYRNNNDYERSIYVVATTHTIYVYHRQFIGGEITTIQEISLNLQIPMTINLSHLLGDLILGVTTDHGNFSLYALDSLGKLNKCLEMPVHLQWTPALDFTVEGSDLLFATGSQDNLIKIWRVTSDTLGMDELSHNDLVRKKVRFRIGAFQYLVTLEAILYGHESWCYSINFNKHKLELLSVSEDKSMIIWHKQKESNTWVEKHRFGNISLNNVGFRAGMFGPNDTVFASGFYGSFHMWIYSNQTQTWTPKVTIGGHYMEVEDIAWDLKGQFLISTSRDCTTRIHAPWSIDGKESTWHEIARPQLHGHEISCLTLLTRYQFVSGANEKVIRMFRAPQRFIENFKKICREYVTLNLKEEIGVSYEALPQGAICPTLELSNKSIFVIPDSDSIVTHGPADNRIYNFPAFNEPPTEEDLNNTLWPEIHKLYGHGNEIFALAATKDAKILASACKANNKSTASIILWNVCSQAQIDELQFHSLTISQLAFSPDSKHLLSVSRDRCWSLFSLDSVSNSYKLSACSDKRTGIHSRIIWCCAWLPDSVHFATGSRDGKVIVWKKGMKQELIVGNYVSSGAYLDLKNDSVTALAVAPIYVNKLPLVVIGVERGIIYLYLWHANKETNPWQLHFKIDQSHAHHKTVKRLSFRSIDHKCQEDNHPDILQLASCGYDGIVRVFDIKL